MSFSSDLFNNNNFGGKTYTFTPLKGSDMNKPKTLSLNAVIANYNNNCTPGKMNTQLCTDASADMFAIYEVIKNDVSTSTLATNENERSELKHKLQSMHSETGILASQHSDYMSVVMSSVLWTTLAGGLIVYAVIKSRK
jgi:hypothetical protein